MSKYILRLDDASEYMDVAKWQRMEDLLDKYNIKPLVGIIPDNRDPMLLNVYKHDKCFWERVNRWKQKGWGLALHGCTHEYITEDGGINPVNNRSEFAGVPLELQKEKIRCGVRILQEHGIEPCCFFAPSHTFDQNTVYALQECSSIRVISDTIAYDVYRKGEFTFVPQQSGRVRALPFKTVTFCYHPNMMNDSDFIELDSFIGNNLMRFTDIRAVIETRRSFSIIDRMLRIIYFARRR